MERERAFLGFAGTDKKKSRNRKHKVWSREREEPVENYRFKVKQLILEINCDYGGAQNTAAGHDDDGGHAWISVD